MTEIVEKGYARKVKVDELTHQEGNVRYLPKPSSIRVVFDCSACYQGESQLPPIARARSKKQAHWGAYKIQKGESSFHSRHIENFF